MFIQEAWAQAGAPPGGDVWSMLPIILMFVVLYFLMIRPQMKRQKETKQMIDALQKGDEVVTAGGLVLYDADGSPFMKFAGRSLTPASWACPMPVSRRSWRQCRPPSPRSPIIRSPRCIPTSASCVLARARSYWPISPG